MRKELPHFQVEEKYGFDQDEYTDPVMKMGGCAATCACESAVYFREYFGIEKACPLAADAISKKDYMGFAKIMKPYLRPRITGVDRLSLYIEGFGAYLLNRHVTEVRMRPFDGTAPYPEAEAALIDAIDRGFPVPCLTLRHKEACFYDFTWHWFLLNGYERKETDGRFYVKVVSYGEYVWLDFEKLWDTGYEKRGGLILYDTDAAFRGNQP